MFSCETEFTNLHFECQTQLSSRLCFWVLLPVLLDLLKFFILIILCVQYLLIALFGTGMCTSSSTDRFVFSVYQSPVSPATMSLVWHNRSNEVVDFGSNLFTGYCHAIHGVGKIVGWNFLHLHIFLHVVYFSFVSAVQAEHIHTCCSNIYFFWLITWIAALDIDWYLLILVFVSIVFEHRKANLTSFVGLTAYLSLSNVSLNRALQPYTSRQFVLKFFFLMCQYKRKSCHICYLEMWINCIYVKHRWILK